MKVKIFLVALTVALAAAGQEQSSEQGGNGQAGAVPAAVPALGTTEVPLLSSGKVKVIPSRTSSGMKSLRLNFRNAPLNQVLDYLSDAAGFVILLETEVRGTIDVWSNQSLDKAEAVTLLNAVLDKKGYGVVMDGRFLTVVSRSEAQRRDNPIKAGNNPSEIPKDGRIVTQIIPVRALNASQLVKDLAVLLPTDTSLMANESANSLIMTDTQANIRRIALILRALNAAGSSVNSIRVFPLVYADAKASATVIKELFPSQDSSSRGNQGGGGFQGFPGGFGGPNNQGGPGGGAGGNSSSESSSQKPSTRVLVTTDENSNAVVVCAPDDILCMIAELIKSIDVNLSDEAEARVFRLRNSDPTEMVNLLSSLFPADTTSNNNNNTGTPFGRGAFPMFNEQQNQSGSGSERARRKGAVLPVADARTASVVVRADKSIMSSIAVLIERLDENPAKKQKVFVYSLQNADVQSVQQVLNDLFQSSNARNSSSANQANALDTRSSTMEQQQNQSQMQMGGQSSGAGNPGL